MNLKVPGNDNYVKNYFSNFNFYYDPKIVLQN